MAQILNEDQFQGQKEIENRRWAMGYKRDGLTRVGGIMNPAKIKLKPGDIIFRSGNRKRAEADDRYGHRWMTQATATLNAEHSLTVDGLIATLRQNLALPPAFTPLDRVFGASVKQPIDAFSGKGNGIFRDDLAKPDQPGAPPLLLGGIEGDGSSRLTSMRFQLFVPGLASVGRAAREYGSVRTAIEWFNLPPWERQFP